MIPAANCATSRRSGEDGTGHTLLASLTETESAFPCFGLHLLGAPPSPRDRGASNSLRACTFPVARCSPDKTGRGHKGRLRGPRPKSGRDGMPGAARSEAKPRHPRHCSEFRTSRVGEFKPREAPQRDGRSWQCPAGHDEPTRSRQSLVSRIPWARRL